MIKKMSKHCYETIIAEDMEWLLKQPETLERTHIACILDNSVDYEYASFTQSDIDAEINELNRKHKIQLSETLKKQREDFKQDKVDLLWEIINSISPDMEAGETISLIREYINATIEGDK